MKISKLRIEHLRNEAHYQFFLLLEKLFTAHPEASGIVVQQLEELNPLVTLEGKLVDAMKASGYTAEIAEADRRVDRDVAGISIAVESALHHFDPLVEEAARHLEIRLKSFRGNIEKKAYEEESAAVKILLADLNGTYAPQVATLNLGAWVTELSAAQEDFERLFLLRNVERAERPQENLKELRRQMDTLYRTIVERIDASAVINAAQTLDAFISELNREVEYFNEHSHRHVRKDLGAGDHTVIEPIDVQPYTGHPVTVVPKVHYREEGKPTENLALGKDFDVAYKNNTDVGTAELTIRGKGAYKGTKTVTFNIARQ
jgi:hypothetical protein